MTPSEYYSEDYRDVELQRERCPVAARLLDAIEQVLTHVLPAFPEPGSEAAELKGWFERAVIGIGTDLERGFEAKPHEVETVESQMRRARSL